MDLFALNLLRRLPKEQLNLMGIKFYSRNSIIIIVSSKLFFTMLLQQRARVTSTIWTFTTFPNFSINDGSCG